MRILTVNIGSSSAKLGLFDSAGTIERRAATDAARPAGVDPDIWPEALARHGERPTVVVHRIVHGGRHFVEPVIITPGVLEELDRLQPYAPEHLPPALSAVRAAIHRFPQARHVACFDTAFHRHMPDVARMYPLPRRLWAAGVRRYGFHGLSCESIMTSLRDVEPRASEGRVIIAHLGGGSSLTAVREGRGIETTMGFSPAGGVMMSRRSGDLDPGVLLWLLAEERSDAEALRRIVTHDAGLAGVSGRTPDMQELLAVEASDSHAADAVELYCYLAKKALGSLVAVLGGVDTLVFTGGIGEHAASVRARIVTGLDAMGLAIDSERNARHAAVISPGDAAATIRVMPTAEDVVLARHAQALLSRLS
jgi:acetate kinase